jgi:hypothetical protein
MRRCMSAEAWAKGLMYFHDLVLTCMLSSVRPMQPMAQAYYKLALASIFLMIYVPLQSSRGDTHALSLFCDERRQSLYFELRQAG